MRTDKRVVVNAADAIAITANRKLTLTAAEDATLTTEPGGDGPPGNLNLTAKGNATMKAAMAVSGDAGTDGNVAAKTALTVKAGTELTLEGGAQVTIKAASLKLQAS